MDRRIQRIEERYKKDKLPKFAPGDTIQVHQRLKEGDRIQVFEGVILGKRGGGLREMVIVRKQSYGVGVEKIFPIHSPAIVDIKLVRKGEVRRAKLYYLRERTGRSARIASGKFIMTEEPVKAQAEKSAPDEVKDLANSDEK